MPRDRTRYYSEEDPEIGVTPSQLKRASKERQVAYLTFWFNNLYEDPAMETPYNGREGGYLYVHGGPYDAREEFYDGFGNLVSEETIEAAVEEVEGDGTLDWAPTHNHPDRADEGTEEPPDDWEPEPLTLKQIEERLKGPLSPRSC
jgi:hypothetical protein